MFITTAGRTNEEMKGQAKAIAVELQIPYVERNKRSVAQMQHHMNDSCIVVGKERLELFANGESEPFFFHPNSAMFRIKRLIRGEHDPFIDACQLRRGMSFVDCTLGLASDSIVASFQVGPEGKVIGTEAEKYLSYIVQRGLNQWESEISDINAAMSRIKVIHIHSYDYLKTLANESVDCVYFDPMFEESILESDGIRALTNIAVYEEFQSLLLEEALRVAKERVVLKDHYQSKRFSQFGFQVIQRKTAKFHFGIIEK
ncbi:class I SAM-dependent methyltransferase [Bacillus sp. CGMCC 1.16607]|uniref:class I SAM-dependent methyltransferase n=1 Tax=Bacillus sp. CGMCC 1.16607 TaxID=3351842 RepID=UPI003639811B